MNSFIDILYVILYSQLNKKTINFKIVCQNKLNECIVNYF